MVSVVVKSDISTDNRVVVKRENCLSFSLKACGLAFKMSFLPELDVSGKSLAESIVYRVNAFRVSIDD